LDLNFPSCFSYHDEIQSLAKEGRGVKSPPHLMFSSFCILYSR